MVKEKEIKAALIDWLYAKGLVRDAVVINEMVVANWARRADVAVANGRLYGFEIKSEFDTLKRLSGQIEIFQQHFDKVMVVAASKFISSVVECYPQEIGVLEVYLHGGKVQLKQIRAGRIKEVKDVQRLASLITRAELERLFRIEGLRLDGDMSRKLLLENISMIDLKKVKSYALSCIKGRYKSSFQAFDTARLIQGTFDSLGLLSKSEGIKSRSQVAVVESAYSSLRSASIEFERPVNYSVLGDEAGAFVDDMPQTVLVRKKG